MITMGYGCFYRGMIRLEARFEILAHHLPARRIFFENSDIPKQDCTTGRSGHARQPIIRIPWISILYLLVKSIPVTYE